MKSLILADNQVATRLGIKFLAVESGKPASLIKEAENLHDLSAGLSDCPDAVVVIDYTCSIALPISFGC